MRNFIKQSLGGSLEPFMVYLTGEEAVDDRELDELKRIVAELDARRCLESRVAGSASPRFSTPWKRSMALSPPELPWSSLRRSGFSSV